MVTKSSSQYDYYCNTTCGKKHTACGKNVSYYRQLAWIIKK